MSSILDIIKIWKWKVSWIRISSVFIWQNILHIFMAHQKFAPSRGECHWAVQAGKGRVRGVKEYFHSIQVVKHGESTRNWDTCPLRSSLMCGLVDDKHPWKFCEITFTTLVRVSPGTIPGKEKSLRWVSPGQYEQVLSVFQRNPLFRVLTPSKRILYYLSSFGIFTQICTYKIPNIISISFCSRYIYTFSFLQLQAILTIDHQSLNI